ncbi:CoA ester lyase [Amycolatopsis ultiminotia]|uniref:CoA ester lyase n=1 Tax=Amycolatopsis ultiminotia TaxID=543629 RepID=A0ABP6V101_9PSEU
MTTTLEGARTFLFVPGNRPDRFAKALAAGADAVIVDLEDAVGAADKAVAREHVRAWLEAGHEAVVRINAAGTPWHEADLEAVAGRARAVMVPKAEDPAALAELASSLPAGTAVLPLIETAVGIAQARQVCAAEAVVRPAFGSVDLALQLGVDHRAREALCHARSALVLAAAAAGCGAPIDGVTTAVDDPAVLADDLRHAAGLGFTGKLCVHPRQIAPGNAAFTPADEQIAWAHAVLAAAEDGSVTTLHGEMIDRPVVARAQAILARV